MSSFFGSSKSSVEVDDGPEFPTGDPVKKPTTTEPTPTLGNDIFDDVEPNWKPKAPVPRAPVKSLLKNPGKFSESERGAMSVLAKSEIFSGFRFEYNKQSPSLTVGHSLAMGGAAEPANYSFMMQYFDQKNVLVGRLGTEGDFHGVAKRFVNNWLTASLVHQRGPKDQPEAILNAELDIKGDDATTSLKLQLHNASPTVSVTYNQAITPALSLGCEGLLMVPGVSAVSSGFKYSKGKHVFSGQLLKQPLSPVAGHLMYQKKVDTRPGSTINYATQLKVDPDPKTGGYSTSWSAGWDYKMQASSVKGVVDSEGKMYSAVEQRINPFMSLLFSGVADLYNNKFSFGFGLQMQMQDLTEEQQRQLEAQLLAMQQGGTPSAAAPAGSTGGDDIGDDDFTISKKKEKKSFM